MRRPLVDGVDGPSFAPQVFHEAMHDDARTNIAIALTAAEKGAAVANYCEVTSLLKDSGGRAEGVEVLDRVTNERFDIRAKAVVFCGGPYTDALRKLGDEKAEDAVAGASGTHVVLPGYYCPRDQGLLDYNTSDGRFLFFLPSVPAWKSTSGPRSSAWTTSRRWRVGLLELRFDFRTGGSDIRW